MMFGVAGGLPGVNSFTLSAPRTVVLGSAYQATTTNRPAIVTINLTSTASNSLLSSTQASQIAEVIIASTAAGVTGATGTKIGVHENTLGGTLVTGLTVTHKSTQAITFALPFGWYFGARATVGANVVITSAFDERVG